MKFEGSAFSNGSHKKERKDSLTSPRSEHEECSSSEEDDLTQEPNKPVSDEPPPQSSSKTWIGDPTFTLP